MLDSDADTEEDSGLSIDGIVLSRPLTLLPSESADAAVVTKSKLLIEAQYRLSMREQKLLAACIAMINPVANYPNGIKVELNDSQLEALTGISKRHLYRFVDKAAKNFHSIPIETPGKKPGTVDYINIAERSTYDPDTRIFEITFHSEMTKHLVDLVRYGSYGLRNLRELSSKYSIRLYELISLHYNRRISGTQRYRITLVSIQSSLGLIDMSGQPTGMSDHYVGRYADFRRRIIEPAIKDINLKTNYEIRYQPIKRGRSVYWLEFTIIATDATVAVIQGERFSVPKGVTDEVIRRWEEQYGIDRVKRNLEYFERRSVNFSTPVTNPVGYITFLLTHNIADLPDVANPYSQMYVGTSQLRAFVQNVVVSIWWDLNTSIRESIEESGSLLNCVVTAQVTEDFMAISKQSGFEVAVATYSREFVLAEWNNYQLALL